MRSYDMRFRPEDVTWIRDWGEVLEALEAAHGPGSKVAVLPDATSGFPEEIWL